MCKQLIATRYVISFVIDLRGTLILRKLLVILSKKIKSGFPGRWQGTDLCRWIGIGKIVEEMPFYRTSALFEHPFYFCHHLKSSPFADFDDYMQSENFVFLELEYFPSWRLILERIIGLMCEIFSQDAPGALLLIRYFTFLLWYTYWNCYQ